MNKSQNRVLQQVGELEVERSGISAAGCGVQHQPGMCTEQETLRGEGGPRDGGEACGQPGLVMGLGSSPPELRPP